MRKRITSLLLTLVMLLSLVPAMGVTANAEDGFVEVSTYEQLRNEVNKGSAKIKLTADIDTTSENSGVGVTSATNLSFKGSGNVLDLNGHKLKLVSNMSVYFIEIYSSDLTIKDSGTNGRIDFEYGEAVLGVQRAIVISRSVGVKKAGSLTVDGGTLSSTYLAIILIESYGSITINGGRLYAPVTNSGNSCYIIHSTNRYDLDDTLQLHVNGGELDGRVVLKRDDSSATGTLKYKVTPIKITNGTFKQGLYATWKTWDSPEGKPKNAVMTMDSPTVEITGGVFEKNNEEYSSYASSIRIDLPTKLRGGTFKNGATIRFVGGKYTWDATQPQYRASIGNSAILRGNDIRTAYGWSKSDWFEIQSPWIYLSPKGSSVTVIPDAWGMKSVTLDGNKIDYFKDWKGTVEERDNSTAHTLKFEWYPLASELVNAGYTYQTKCEHYISGSTAVQQTDTIASDKTSHTVTIEKGVDPKVYSYDLQLNLQKNGSSVGIFTNDHIVKLVVNEAPVAPPSLTGQVYYTSGIVYGSRISISAMGIPEGATPAYQWQRSTNGGKWENIDGATDPQYTPKEADMGDTVSIRVKITANGYLGEIVGAALKVSKAANNNYPEVIQLEAVKDDEGHYIGFKINNYDPKYEYVYSTTDTPKWNENQITSATVTDTSLTSDKTYYVFARFEETATHTAGSIVSKNSIGLFDKVPLQHVLLEGYDSGNMIYIKKGESVTLKVSADPINANSWKEITFKDSSVSSSGTSNIAISSEKIDASGENAASFTDHSITITGVSTGSATLDASYSGPDQPYYSRWNVTVYDETNVEDALRLENVYTYADITLSVNDEAKLPTDLPKLLPEGSGYHLEWRIVKTGVGTGGALYLTSDDNITLENDKIIKPKAAHTGSARTRLDLVAVKDGTIKLLDKTSLFYVTVTEAPDIELAGVTVAPKQVNLELNKTFQLSAVRQPANAPGDLTWVSSNTGVATVDSTGMVTAKGQGTAKITVTCGDKKATCTVLVDHKHSYSDQPYLYLDPGNHYQECVANDGSYNIEAHEFTPWTDNGNDTHSRHCTVCKMTDGSTYTETAEHNWQWVVETAATPNAAGKQHEECVDCHAVKAGSETEIPMLTSIMVEHLTVTKPVKDAAAAAANTTDSDYYVANTEWMAEDGTPLVIGGKFQPGTVYTVKITLETAGAGVFSVKSTYNTIEGKTAAVNPALTDDKHADSVILTYTFDKTAGGYHPGTGTGTGATTYAITVKSAKNGDVTASHKTASKGTAVTLTVDPDKGYVLDTLTVLDGKDKEIKLTEKNGKYTFTMPDSKVTVAATFKASAPTGKNPFIDVPAGSYYEDAVVWAVEKGITSGTSAVTFDPNGICTRAQAVTFLWRAAGSPAPKTKVMPFTDVPAGSYYYDAVLWAMEQGITKGTSDTAFSPNATCTRAQIVTFLWRANGSPAVSGNSAFTDVASDAYYAAAVAWAEKNGVTGGIGNGLFGSGNNCTRAQIVTFLYRSVK